MHSCLGHVGVGDSPDLGEGFAAGVALLLVSLLTWFTWWVNQGNPNWIGSMLYGLIPIEGVGVGV